MADSTKVTAQVTPDTTLPNNTVVLLNGNLIDIKGGTRPENGANLFHSLQNFSVESGQTARFIHHSGIQNIINRVTGGSISHINGTIQTLIDGTRDKGNANIFIINPQGIIFGGDAKLDIGGSFFASTADSIVFEDGSFYSAVNPQPTPLLTISVPTGLQYNSSSPGDITVQGNGNNLFFDSNTFATDRSNRPGGLQVSLGKTLALVGGNVNLSGGNITAEQGRIEIGAVQGEGLVKLNPSDSGGNFDYSQVRNFQDINLTGAASIDVSGNRGGEVQVMGRNISLVDGSAILGNTTGDSTGGNLSFQATDTLQVIGVNPNFDLSFSTTISTDVEFAATGNGGKIVIDTKNLIVADGGQIGSGTFGAGDGGIIDIQAEDIQLISGGFGPSGIFTTGEFGTGNGGAVVIKTDNLLVEEGAAISSDTFSDGNAGNIDITAKDIQLVGTAFGEFPSTLSTNSFSPTGNGGNIKVKTETLKLVDGAQIQTSTVGSGNAGALDIQAEQIEIFGGSPAGKFSGIFANVEESADGNGGLIKIQTESLQLLSAGQISTRAFGSGNGGTLDIKAEDILVSGFIDNTPSGLFSSANFGVGGDVNIQTTNLNVSQGGQIAASTFGVGNAGNLTVKAEVVNLSGFVDNGRSGLFSTAIVGTGNGGKLTVETNQLTIRDGATISASNFSSRNPDIKPGEGTAGDIEITANILELDNSNSQEAASITASTFAGTGGNVTLNVEEIFARNGSQITAEARGIGDGGNLNLITNNLQLETGGLLSTNTIATGNAGIINVQANNVQGDGVGSGIFSQTTADSAGDGGKINLKSNTLTLSNAAAISTSSQGTGNAGTIDINATRINLLSNGQITTNSTNLGQAGNINILFERLETNQGQITATSEQTGGGDITLTATASEIFLQNNSLISTSVFDSTGGGGNITITADVIAGLENSDIRANAVFGAGGNIQINTKGLFTSPDSDISASSSFGVDGNVEINRTEEEKLKVQKLPDKLFDYSRLISRACKPITNSFTIIAQGLPLNPTEKLISPTIWSDLRGQTPPKTINTTTINNLHQQTQPSQLLEAQGWVVNAKGKIELVTNSPQVNAHVSQNIQGNCQS